MYGKSNTLLVRLSGVIHVLNTCVETIKNFKDCSNSKEITKEFKSDLETHKSKIRNELKIQKSSLLQAKNLLNYFNSNRAIIAGYKGLNIKADGSNLDEEIIEYLKKKKENFQSDQKIFDKDTKKIFSNILLMPGIKVETVALREKHRYTVEKSTAAFEELAKLNLGFVTKEKSTNRKNIQSFNKINIEECSERNLKLLKILHSLGIKADDYKMSYNQNCKQKYDISDNSPFTGNSVETKTSSVDTTNNTEQDHSIPNAESSQKNTLTSSDMTVSSNMLLSNKHKLSSFSISQNRDKVSKNENVIESEVINQPSERKLRRYFNLLLCNCLKKVYWHNHKKYLYFLFK